MSGDKFAMKSKGVWGGIIAFIPSLAMALGWELGDLGGVEDLGNQVIAGVVALAALGAIVGRFVAGSELYFWK